MRSQGSYDLMPPEVYAGVDARLFRYRGVLSPDECDAIIERSRPFAVPGLLPLTDTIAHPIKGDDPVQGAVARLGQEVIDRLWTVVAHVNSALSGWHLPITDGAFAVSHYLTGHDMGMHVDDIDRGGPPWDMPHRGIGSSMLLSEGHEGGELIFRVGAEEFSVVEIGRGDAVFFGGSVEHAVATITKGERWVLLMNSLCGAATISPYRPSTGEKSAD